MSEEANDIFPEAEIGAAAGAHVDHVRRYLWLQHRRRSGVKDDDQRLEDLYLVDVNRNAVREIIGFKMRGHPMVVLGAINFPSHAQSPVAHGRPSLAWFLSKPTAPTPQALQGVAPPPGVLEVFLPLLDETVPQMIDRIRANPAERGVHIDVDLVDFAFDLRFMNPSIIPRQGAQAENPERRVFRTTAGHVLSGLSTGLYKSLRKGLGFVTLTDAMQHRKDDSVHLPTLAINRSVLAVETLAEAQGGGPGPRNLFFHPVAANPAHLFGPAYETA
jgi:hypothetical protein